MNKKNKLPDFQNYYHSENIVLPFTEVSYMGIYANKVTYGDPESDSLVIQFDNGKELCLDGDLYNIKEIKETYAEYLENIRIMTLAGIAEIGD